MWKVNKNIKIQKDEFKINQVDCFTKPHALLADSIYPGIYHAYCYAVAFMKSYGFSHGFTENFDWSFGIHPYVMKKLGFTYHIHYCHDTNSLKNNLEEFLNKGIRILLPGNLYHVYYSWAYQQTHALHLFFIHGYNSGTDVFNVVDNLHNMKNPIPVFADISKDFTYFNMKGEDLRGAFQGLADLQNYYYCYKFITIDGEQQDIHIPDTKSLLGMYAKIADSGMEAERFREIYCADAIITYFREGGTDVAKEIRHFQLEMIFGNKEAFMIMTLKLLQNLPHISEQELKECKSMSAEILQKWRKFSLIFYKKLYEKSLSHVNELKPYFVAVTDQEKQMAEKVKNIIERLE